MILELADIRIQPGQQAAFEAALAQGIRSVIAPSEGYLSHTVAHGIESPERYLLQIRWQTLEDHTVKFRGSAAFTAWRALVGPFFAAPPVVEHFNLMA
ncbi:MAG: antibiotic biosynthesis monooxygenase family protein [Burkholderiaceae bacterium]